jgi:hypothetical protein
MKREPTEMELRVAAVLRGPGAACFMSEDDALETARAVIRAMREPTTDMLRDALIGMPVRTEPAAAIWEVLIDAASPEDK